MSEHQHNQQSGIFYDDGRTIAMPTGNNVEINGELWPTYIWNGRTTIRKPKKPGWLRRLLKKGSPGFRYIPLIQAKDWDGDTVDWYPDPEGHDWPMGCPGYHRPSGWSGPQAYYPILICNYLLTELGLCLVLASLVAALFQPWIPALWWLWVSAFFAVSTLVAFVEESVSLFVPHEERKRKHSEDPNPNLHPGFTDWMPTIVAIKFFVGVLAGIIVGIWNIGVWFLKLIGVLKKEAKGKEQQPQPQPKGSKPEQPLQESQESLHFKYLLQELNKTLGAIIEGSQKKQDPTQSVDPDSYNSEESDE